MTDFPDVKLKVLVSFPAQVHDGVGIDAVTANGIYQFDLAYDDFAPPVAGIADAANQNLLLWNSVTEVYTLTPVSLLGGGGGVPEAPNDGIQYGRQSLAWTPVVAGGAGMAIGGTITGATLGSVLFAGVGGVLAQNNAHFFWDNTNFSLNISGTPAIFKIANIGGDNWFVGGSGNFTVSGSSNYGLGETSLSLLSTGNYNLAIGSFALRRLTTGRNNVAVGTNAMSFLDTGEQNVAIGRAALDEQNDQDAIGIGDNALGNYNGWGTVGIGTEAAFNLDSGTKNVFIGYRCGSSLNGPSNRNIWFGGYSGSATTINDTILFANGDGSVRALDYNFTNTSTWTMGAGVPLAFQGSSSGTVKLATAAAAGSWTMTLPTTTGANENVLQTDGAGTTSWRAIPKITVSNTAPPSPAVNDVWIDTT